MNINKEMDFLKTMQQFVATTAIGTSALRNQGKGSHDAVRKVLSDFDLSSLKNMGKDEYTEWVDTKTDSVLCCWKGKSQPWGAARKSVNLFMRDALYNQYLNSEYIISGIEQWMEIALDSKVSMGLRNRFKSLPRWPGLRHLKHDVSDQYQECAQKLADENGIHRVHLDIWLWLENR
jgi:hypothetical protein